MDLTDGRPLCDCWQKIAEKLVYTGAIDEYFGYRLGKLEWRTVSFEEEVLDTPNYQGNAVIAYSGDGRSPIPMISIHSVGDLLYRRQS